MRLLLLAYLSLTILLIHLLSTADAIFGSKKEDKKGKDDKKEREFSGKDSAALGLMGLADMAKNLDTKSMMELQAMMEDPETMAEVQKLMQDPEFQQEMNKITSDPTFTKAMSSAQELLGKEKAGDIYKHLAEERNNPKKSDFEIGMSELAKAAKNPKVLAEALELLKDPEMAAEVQAMMKDPAFVAEMQKVTSDPNFKSAMERAAGDIELMSKEAKLNKLKAELL